MTFLQRLLAVLICTVSFTAFAGSSPSPAEAFGQLPMYKSVQIFFDGKRIAYLQKLNGKYMLINRSLEDDSKPQVYGLAEGAIREFRWVSNDRILVGMTTPFYSKGDRELFTLSRTGLLNVHSNEMIWPFSDRKFVNFVYGPWLVHRLPDDPDYILMSGFSEGEGEMTTGSRISKEIKVTYRGLYRVNIRSGDIQELEVTRDTATRWLTNRAGEVRLKYQYHRDADDEIWWSRNSADTDFVPLTRSEEGEDVFFSADILGTDEALEKVYYAETDDKGRGRVVRVSIEGGSSSSAGSSTRTTPTMWIRW